MIILNFDGRKEKMKKKTSRITNRAITDHTCHSERKITQ